MESRMYNLLEQQYNMCPKLFAALGNLAYCPKTDSRCGKLRQGYWKMEHMISDTWTSAEYLLEKKIRHIMGKPSAARKRGYENLYETLFSKKFIQEHMTAWLTELPSANCAVTIDEAGDNFTHNAFDSMYKTWDSSTFRTKPCERRRL